MAKHLASSVAPHIPLCCAVMGQLDVLVELPAEVTCTACQAAHIRRERDRRAHLAGGVLGPLKTSYRRWRGRK